MTSLPILSNKTARALFLERHGLSQSTSGNGKGADLQSVVDQLGFVQLDSINTVARAQHMILQARRPAYRAKNLAQLHDQDRGVFEHWTHDASVISMQHYPHWQLKFRRNGEKLVARRQKWAREGYPDKLEEVYDQIAREGPAGSAELGADEPRSSGGWWDWHPSKTALEYLWQTGKLTVLRRDGFRKIYDLTENVVPSALLKTQHSEAETIDWACRAALARLGFATSGELAAFWALITPAEAREWCKTAKAQGEITEVNITQTDGRLRKSFVFPETLDQEPAAPLNRLRIMSPFDPALRDRNRSERLFGFSYRIEIFVPEAKRKYGYYVFPILEGARLVGRIDMKAQRDQDRLHVRALWPENGVPFGTGRMARLQAALDRSARLAEVSSVSFETDWLRAP